MENYSMNKSQTGFSLIELLVVLVILGLIAGLVVPNIIGQTEKAKVKAASATIQRLAMGVEAYYLDNGEVPERLADLVSEPGNVSNWTGPYIKKSILKDPWGEAYQFRYPGEHGEFDIVSFGPDKQMGGEGKNADITSWE
jgi:general secretion pathway protein G